MEIEKVGIDTWIREKVSEEELTENIRQAQLNIIEELIKNRDY